MALSDNTQISAIATALGIADAAFQADLDLTNGGSAASEVKTARGVIVTQSESAANSDFDLQQPLIAAFRAIEKNLPTTLNPILSNAITTLNTYFLAQNGVALRTYFNGRTTGTTISWTTAFRNLWRRSQNTELIVRLGNLTATSGPTWGTTLSNQVAISLDSGLEIHTNPSGVIGNAAIVVSMVLAHASGATEMATVTIPANSTALTVIPIISSLSGSTNKFVSVQSLSVSGGTSGDIFEVWVAN